MNDPCESFRERIAQDLVDELDAVERDELETHLAGCRECAREREELKATVGTLRSLHDERPPRHFFVHSEERRGPLRSFSTLPPAWKGALAASLILLVAAAGLLIVGTHVRVEHGVLMVSVGQTPAERWIEPLKTEILSAAVERSSENDRVWIERVRGEFAETLASRDLEQRQIIDAALRELDTRAGETLASSHLALRQELDRGLLRVRNDVEYQRREDLGRVRDHLDQFAANDLRLDERTEAILAAVVEMSEWDDGARRR
jgi:anti-sigma factor RsiW